MLNLRGNSPERWRWSVKSGDLIREPFYGECIVLKTGVEPYNDTLVYCWGDKATYFLLAGELKDIEVISESR